MSRKADRKPQKLLRLYSGGKYQNHSPICALDILYGVVLKWGRGETGMFFF